MLGRTVWITLLGCVFLVSVTLLWMRDVSSAEGDSGETAVPVPRLAAGEEGPHELVLPSGLEQFVRPLATTAPQPALQDSIPRDEAMLESPNAGVDLPHVPRSQNTQRLFVDPSFFEQRYREASLEELVIAQEHIQTEYFELLPKAIDEVYELGLFEEEIVEPPVSGKLELPEARPSFGIATVLRTEVLDNGQRLVKRASVPWDEYRYLYDLEDESHWLRRRIKEGKLSSDQEK